MNSETINILPIRCNQDVVQAMGGVLQGFNLVPQEITGELQGDYKYYWTITYTQYPEVINALERFGEENNVPLIKIPQKFMNVMLPEDEVIEVNDPDGLEELTLFNYQRLQDQRNPQSVDQYIEEKKQHIGELYPHQVESIKFAIKQNGRILLADDKVGIKYIITVI